jgi:mannose-6-phosphate isomerase-like protein (cupin superfamily)
MSEMNELNKGLEIALTGQQTAEEAARALEQIRAWGLAMPEVTPLAIDFGLGDFPKIGEVEFWIANEVEAGYCGKFLFVGDGQTCPRHWHQEKLETFFIVRGSVRMEFGDEVRTLHAGDILKMPVNVPHGFTGIGPALLLEVSKPSIIDDNYFEDANIPIGGNYQPTTVSPN